MRAMGRKTLGAAVGTTVALAVGLAVTLPKPVPTPTPVVRSQSLSVMQEELQLLNSRVDRVEKALGLYTSREKSQGGS